MGGLEDTVGKRGGGAPEDGSRLSAMAAGATALVTGIDPATTPEVVRRLRELGFRTGIEVHCLRRAPLGSPTAYRVGESDICLRRGEALAIAVGPRA